MATNTTNFNLKKPAYTDTADIADINGNMDKVDVSLNGLADAIAIVANNNTHAAITAGQYVYVHGHGTLAEGLYKANSNIAANATLTSSNLTADSSGGLNSAYASLNSKLMYQVGDKIRLDNENIFASRTLGTSGQFFTYIPLDKPIATSVATITMTAYSSQPISRLWKASGNFIQLTITNVGFGKRAMGLLATFTVSETTPTNEMCALELGGYDITFS